MRKTLAELLRSTGRIFIVWWLASFAGVFVYFTGIVQWALGEALGSTFPEILRVSLGGGLLVVGISGVVVSLLRVFHEMRVERDALRTILESAPHAELGFVFSDEDPVCAPPIPPERSRERGIIRVGLSNSGNLRVKGARVTVAWTDPIGTRYDEPLTGYRLKSYLYDETEFDIPCDSSGAPTAYAHVGQVLLVNEGKIFMEFGMGASTKEAPIVRVALRIEHDQGVYNGILVFTFHEPMGFDTMLIQGNQASSATRSETSHT